MAASPAKVSDGVLVGPNGMSLYTFDRDAMGSGKTVCNGPCATNWPPLMASDMDKSSGDYSVITRDDGKKQWAFKGKPLYFWVKDGKPGDRTGDGAESCHAGSPADQRTPLQSRGERPRAGHPRVVGRTQSGREHRQSQITPVEQPTGDHQRRDGGDQEQNEHREVVVAVRAHVVGPALRAQPGQPAQRRLDVPDRPQAVAGGQHAAGDAQRRS
jgi:predicted lipoprotein with Yx(FWY)xxD motif